MRDDVVTVEVASEFLVVGSLAEFDLSYEIPRSGGDESEWRWWRRVCRETGCLPANCSPNEFIVGLVVIESVDYLIAVGPGVAAGLVFVVAVGFAVVSHVEPMASPALAVARRCQQAVD